MFLLNRLERNLHFFPVHVFEKSDWIVVIFPEEIAFEQFCDLTEILLANKMQKGA